MIGVLKTEGLVTGYLGVRDSMEIDGPFTADIGRIAIRGEGLHVETVTSISDDGHAMRQTVLSPAVLSRGSTARLVRSLIVEFPYA